MKRNDLPDTAAVPVAGAPLHRQQVCYLDADAPPQNALDLGLQSAVARITNGVSPIAMSLAFQDWLMHLAVSPGKQSDLLSLLTKQATDWAPVWAKAATPSVPATASVVLDARFADAGWSSWPFNAFSTAFLQTQEFWQQATSGVRGVAPHHAEVVNFTSRQLLDMVAPSNFVWSNPEVLRSAVDTKGQNFVAGWARLAEDSALRQQKTPRPVTPGDAPFRVGQDVALTPGKVVYCNDLVELIQYAPRTATVYREPILIVPSWIMKYYILDLSPHNSMVRFLVEQGHTVFMVSWRNPGAADSDLGMDDYLRLGLFDVLGQVARISGNQAVHACGYCLGGTLLAIAAAALAQGKRPDLAPLKSITLLAGQTDFSEPGELGLFIDDSELAFLDALMWDKGYLDGAQMTGSFQLLNSRDLIWSQIMREYMLGVRPSRSDLMAWNADATRLPYRMHSEYLKHLFLHNDLADGRYDVDGKAVVLKDIKASLFVVGTERDHVAPWRSVYKIALLTDAPVDFVLASGGHNAGIISEPGHAHRSFKIHAPMSAQASYVGPDDWLAGAQQVLGSWWPHWHQWLGAHSHAKRIAPPIMGAGTTIGDAPGTYVLGT